MQVAPTLQLPLNLPRFDLSRGQMLESQNILRENITNSKMASKHYDRWTKTVIERQISHDFIYLWNRKETRSSVLCFRGWRQYWRKGGGKAILSLRKKMARDPECPNCLLGSLTPHTHLEAIMFSKISCHQKTNIMYPLNCTSTESTKNVIRISETDNSGFEYCFTAHVCTSE